MAGPAVRRTLSTALVCVGLLAACGIGSGGQGCRPSRIGAAGRWESYVSRHCTFTVRKPAGWAVRESYADRPRAWGFTLEEPGGRARLDCTQEDAAAASAAASPAALRAALRAAVGALARQLPKLRLAPTARLRELPDESGRPRRLALFDGTYQGLRGPREVRCLVAVGGGRATVQRLEAEAGQLKTWEPTLLQALASLRVAKGVFASDEGGALAAGTGPLATRRLAGGWATLSLPPDWKLADLGKGSFLASDAAERQFVMVAGAEFVAPRYFVRGVPGVLASPFRPPSQAFAFSAAETGRADRFQFQFVKPRPDLLQGLRAAAGPLRAVAVEDFGYTCQVQGRPYQGFSTGGCSGDALGASWRLWHFTVLAPREDFERTLPLLAAILGSYELNRELAGRHMANNLRAYYAGLRDLGNTLARDAEQMRRENLALHMEKGRVQDYISYQTTRMIMGDFDYLAGASGYVRASGQGLFAADGTRITQEPYGESLTRSMQEVNSRELFEQLRR